MAKLHLVLANKNYSSWSLRVWLAMAAMGLRFEETIIPLDTPRTAGQIRKHSGAGRLPVLHHGDIVIWESLAILEYLAEIYPDKPFWPRNKAARAIARAVANEMHAGFQGAAKFLPDEPSPAEASTADALQRRVHGRPEAGRDNLERLPQDVRPRRAVPLRSIFHRRFHVRAGCHPH